MAAIRRRSEDFVDRGVLPKERAEDCAREYQQVRRAFAKTILPHVDQELMKTGAVASQWLRPRADGRAKSIRTAMLRSISLAPDSRTIRSHFTASAFTSAANSAASAAADRRRSPPAAC